MKDSFRNWRILKNNLEEKKIPLLLNRVTHGKKEENKNLKIKIKRLKKRK